MAQNACGLGVVGPSCGPVCGVVRGLRFFGEETSLSAELAACAETARANIIALLRFIFTVWVQQMAAALNFPPLSANTSPPHLESVH